MEIGENWSRVRGRVHAWDPPRSAGESGLLTLVIDRVDDVASATGTRRNLLRDALGTTLQIVVPASAAPRVQAKPGATAIVTVRRGRPADRVFAHPDHIDVTS